MIEASPQGYLTTMPPVGADIDLPTQRIQTTGSAAQEQWEEKKKRIPATRIICHTSGLRYSNEENKPITLADISSLIADQLKTFLDTQLTSAIISGIKKATQAEVDDRAATRAKELDLIIQHANDEKKLIINKGWRGPSVLAPPVVIYNDTKQPTRPRFDPNVLPRYVDRKSVV